MNSKSLLAAIPTPVLIAVGATVAVLVVVIIAIRMFVYICRPDEILVLSGREHKLADGRRVGFRVVTGGRAFRVPILETAQRMDMSLISVAMNIEGAYSEGNIPLNVHAIANVKVSSDPRFVGNAIERFLGRSRAEIARVAKEMLEGHLRGVLATMTPEEVNEDRLKFANALKAETEDDLQVLGLQLDTLKVQHVSDNVEYLGSLGRKSIAEILKAAAVAESDAQRAAIESEQANLARGEVARTNAQARVQAKQNELRQIRAQLDAEASSEEERAAAAGKEARALAEQELQRVRGQLEQLRLEADITIPAEAKRVVAEHRAAGSAAIITAEGEAMSQALAIIADAWQQSRGQAMDLYVLQHLDEIFGKVADAARRLKVNEVNLVDSGDGKTLPAYLSAYPATISALLSEVCTTLGVDIGRILSGDTKPDGWSPAPPLSRKAPNPAIG